MPFNNKHPSNKSSHNRSERNGVGYLVLYRPKTSSVCVTGITIAQYRPSSKQGWIHTAYMALHLHYDWRRNTLLSFRSKLTLCPSKLTWPITGIRHPGRHGECAGTCWNNWCCFMIRLNTLFSWNYGAYRAFNIFIFLSRYTKFVCANGQGGYRGVVVAFLLTLHHFLSSALYQSRAVKCMWFLISSFF